MQLKINNQLQIFSPVHQFRERWDLPENFNITLFEAKEWQGLGSLEGAGPTLAIVRQRITAAMPDRLDPSNLTIMAEELTRLFRGKGETHYLVDTRLACPAAGFMVDLCAEVSQAMCHALTY
jgi:hypothetical protein